MERVRKTIFHSVCLVISDKNDHRNNFKNLENIVFLLVRFKWNTAIILTDETSYKKTENIELKKLKTVGGKLLLNSY